MAITPRLQLLKKVSLDSLRLRPYGETLLTPAVRVWLGFAWVVILLMASTEGIVWGLVGASIVPQDSAWLRPIAGLFMLALMFSIIWIVDASLVMSERPVLRARRWYPGLNQGTGALIRWALGILVRLAIVAVSLYVTAPFLAKLIRSDDIAAYHQRQVEQYFDQRDARLQAQIQEHTAQIEQSYRDRTQPLTQEIERLSQALSKARQRRAAIETELQPEIEILRKDLAAAQQKVGDEILGRHGRPEGHGPEARKWEANANLINAKLTERQSELDQRVAAVAHQIAELEQLLESKSKELQRLGQERQARIDRISSQIKAKQIAPLPPRLTFAARSKALQALKNSPEERGVPHFETVEGFAQAALGVLFFSLIAIKLFEPPAVRAYFSETIQMQYRKYLEGGLADIPGFELGEDPSQRLNPNEFNRLWMAYERDPGSFFADRQSLIEVREPLTNYLAEQALDQEILAHRRENLEHEMTYARRRRERELAAFDRELSLRTAQLQAQLANETKALKDQRRIELATELQRARTDWTWRKSQEEEELRQRRDAFEQEQQRAREDLRLREQEVESMRERTQARIREAEVSKQLAHQEKLTELENKRQREHHKAHLSGVREEIARLRALEVKQRAERQSLRDAGRKLEDTIESLRARAEAAAAEVSAQHTQAASLSETLAQHTNASKETTTRKISFWPRSERVTDTKTERDILRDLKAIEKAERSEAERLVKLRDELHSLELRKRSSDSELREADARVAETEARIQRYEDRLSTLLDVDETRWVGAENPSAA